MMRSLLSKAVALAMLCALLAAASVYPASKILMGAALAAYAGLLWWRPALWLLCVPALLPILDFAPWTGWFFLDELDLLLLATAAVAYWRLGAKPPEASLPRFFALALGLVTASFALACVIGMAPFPALDANSFSNYNSPYNSLRVAKGLAWALLLLPLLRRSAGPELANFQRYLVPGMLLGLAGAALAVVWERAVFPGLLNFSSDYRPTAPFSAMHTGGASLDAYLAISFPFIALWLVGQSSRRKLALALGILLLGVYAGLATFSRDVYLAYGSSGAILLVLTLGHRLRRGTLDKRMIVVSSLLLAVLAYFLTEMFGTSGYRGLLAALGLLAAASILAACGGRIRAPALFGALALLVLLADLALFVATDKGAYLGFTLSAALFAGGAGLLVFGPSERKAQGIAIAGAAFLGLALTTALVAYHWGGGKAIGDAAVIIALALGMIALNRLPAKPVWQLNRASMTVGFFCTIVFAITIPIAGSYYTGSRFATVGNDIGVRLRHWQEALDMMTPGWQAATVGMGLGRYPDTYFWKNTHGELPGSYSYELEKGNNQLLRLGAPQYAVGYGEVLRMLQHVDLNPGTRYRLSADIRRLSDKARISMMVCERWLLYPQNCVDAPFKLGAPDGQWRRYETTIDSRALGQPRLLRTPTQLELSNNGSGAYLEIDNVSLVDAASGEELVRNGTFSASNDYWFFSSDRNHFPWHVKNFPVNTYFEMGWAGIATMALLIAYVAGALAMRGLHGELAASVHLAALVGFLLVGLFDSLFDVPRLTLIFFLVACAACMGKARTNTTDGRTRRRVRREPAPADATAG